MDHGPMLPDWIVVTHFAALTASVIPRPSPRVAALFPPFFLSLILRYAPMNWCTSRVLLSALIEPISSRAGWA